MISKLKTANRKRFAVFNFDIAENLIQLYDLQSVPSLIRQFQHHRA
jgi:hypothetical protein